MRQELADKYIQGDGIEIGALCHPLPTSANVVYVDRFDREGLHEQYPDIPIKDMVLVNVVADGETLEIFDNDSKDFIIANHFLEHCEFPIKTVENWVRVLKKDGIIYCAIPNKDFTFDKNRNLTPITHLIYECQTGVSDTFAHYMDATNGDDMMSGNLMDTKYSIHYHVWDRTGIIEFFEYMCKILPLKIEEYQYTDERVETIFILRKTV